TLFPRRAPRRALSPPPSRSSRTTCRRSEVLPSSFCFDAISIVFIAEKVEVGRGRHWLRVFRGEAGSAPARRRRERRGRRRKRPPERRGNWPGNPGETRWPNHPAREKRVGGPRPPLHWPPQTYSTAPATTGHESTKTVARSFHGSARNGTAHGIFRRRGSARRRSRAPARGIPREWRHSISGR